ncbi:pentatricopeptide repeat-containing protein [Citrus sinensis]|uniref:Pentatricopeptide repeat-containing protein n=1 Tax=Citrus sinensis TaxID=2711 RepID=A0ACB8KGN4_CITSI|nr:pentatricopeptide repeat-containing protein [Citrus sinensis]
MPSSSPATSRTAFKVKPSSSLRNSKKPISLNSENEPSSLHSNSVSTVEEKTKLLKYLSENSKSGEVELNDALCFFNYMIHMQPTPFMPSFNSLLGALAGKKYYVNFICLSERLNTIGLLPDFVSLNILMNCFCKMIGVSDAFVALGRILRKVFSPDVVTLGCLIRGLCMQGKFTEASGLFTKFVAFDCRPNVIPNVICYASIIDGLCKDGFVNKVRVLFLDMKGRGIYPDAFVYNSLIRVYCCAVNWEDAKGNTSAALELHEEFVNGNGELGVICHPDVLSYCSIINSLCKDVLVDKAKELFLDMKSRGIIPDVVVYSSLIDGYCLMGRIDDARKLFVSIESEGCIPDTSSYNTLINSYSKIEKVEEALSLYGEMISMGVRPDVISYNT